MTTCQRCARQLIDTAAWHAIPLADRARLYRSHARAWSGDLCRTCRPRGEKRVAPDGLEWRGGWRRVGLVMVPDGPRPIQESEPVGRDRPIIHGTDTGYSRHKKAREDACEPCKQAHRDTERARAAAKRARAA